MAKQDNPEVPGNAFMSQAAMDRFVHQNGRAVLSIEHHAHRLLSEGSQIKAVRFKGPDDPHGEWLGIITARLEGEDVVSFTTGASFDDVLRSVSNRLNNGTLKWKDDEYA